MTARSVCPTCGRAHLLPRQIIIKLDSGTLERLEATARARGKSRASTAFEIMRDALKSSADYPSHTPNQE